jgi:hypothetical protein
MSKLQTRKIFGKIGELNLVNREVYCEQTNEWFNEVECFIDITRDLGTTLTFPNGVEVVVE